MSLLSHVLDKKIICKMTSITVYHLFLKFFAICTVFINMIILSLKVQLGGTPTECPVTVSSSPVKSEEANKEQSPDTPQSKTELKSSTPVSVKAEADTTSGDATSKPNSSIFGGTPSKTLFGGEFLQVNLLYFYLLCLLFLYFNLPTSCIFIVLPPHTSYGLRS